MKISKEVLDFLVDLDQNNNREWFNERKPIFKGHQEVVKSFFSAVQTRLEETDQIESHNIFRIYRDVRFSKDKSPFKSRFAGGFKRATSALRGGYYLNIEPGKSMAGGGFFAPNSEDLKRIRQEFEQDDTEIRAIINNETFKSFFGELQGDGVKSAPRGFDPSHPAIDLIRKKQFYVIRSFTDKEVTQPDFIEKVIETYMAIRPYFDYMSAVLTSNADGESLI